MKLWIVVTIAGNVAMTVGPLPAGVDMQECRERASDKMAETRLIWEERGLADDPRMAIDGKRVTLSDLKIECVFSDDRPQ